MKEAATNINAQMREMEDAQKVAARQIKQIEAFSIAQVDKLRVSTAKDLQGADEKLRTELRKEFKGAVSEAVSQAREIPQVEEPMRARPPNLQPKPPHAAPGAFEIPAELLTYPIPPQIVVGLAQESFNRWLNNISTEISHKNRDELQSSSGSSAEMLRSLQKENQKLTDAFERTKGKGISFEWKIPRCLQRLRYLSLLSEPGLWLDSDSFHLGSLGPLEMRLYAKGLRGGDGQCAVALRFPEAWYDLRTELPKQIHPLSDVVRPSQGATPFSFSDMGRVRDLRGVPSRDLPTLPISDPSQSSGVFSLRGSWAPGKAKIRSSEPGPSYWRVSLALALRKRSVETSETEALQRRLTALDLTLIGVGASVGAGIFVITGIAAKPTGPAVCFSFLLAGISSIFSALCYAELSARIPVSGSVYLYAFVAFGEFIALLIGLNVLVDYHVGAAVNIASCALYLEKTLRLMFGDVCVWLPSTQAEVRWWCL
eukprot:g32701.t1